MRKTQPWIIAVVIAVLSACPVSTGRAQNGAPAEKDKKEVKETGEKELAQRFVAVAQDTLRQKTILPPHFRQAAGLIMAACDVDPAEPRYPRMLYEAMLQLHDNAGALKAIKAYRQLAPKDEWAMAVFIDLWANNIETAEARLQYFRSLVDTEIPAPVRSLAAFRAAQIAEERGQDDLHDTLIGKALEFNPLNLDALRARLDQRTANGTPAERLETLFTMLKSNPVQPAVASRIAQELAVAGLAEDALRHYRLAVELSTATGVFLGRDFAMAYAAELTMLGQPQLMGVTRTIVEGLLKQDGGDVEAILLGWLAARGAGDKEAATKSAGQVVNAALNRVTVLRQKLGDTTATTRPVESVDAPVIPDLTEDVKKLPDEKFQELQIPYTQAVADLAWYLVYVADKPAESAKLLPALKSLLDEKDPVVTRIEGWIALAQGQTDQASMKLKAVADQDVIAQMGTLLLWAKNPAEKGHANEAGVKLLTEHPAGLLGALLMDGMRDIEVKLAPREDSTPLQKLVKDFPKNWLTILDAPQSFYAVRAQMNGGRVLFPYGEPMIATVTIKNISPFDLTIGPEGVIKQDLWFDASLRGLVQQVVTGAAYERLGYRLVLKPGDSVTQSLRFDQGQLANVLSGNPQPTLLFFGKVRTNPRGEGNAPCGQEVTFAPITERAGFNAADPQSLKVLVNLIANGTAAEKMRSLELVASLLEGFKTQLQQNPNPQIQMLMTSFLDLLNRSTTDEKLEPGVKTWASFLSAFHNSDKRQGIMERLFAKEKPSDRLIGLLVANSLTADQQQALLTKMLEDPKVDPAIQLYGSGMMEIAKLLAAQPAPAPQAAPPTPNPLAPETAPPAQPRPVNPLEGIPLKP